MTFLFFFQVLYILGFNNTPYLSLHFRFILFKRWSSNLSGSDILEFLEFINLISILFYNFIEFIVLLYTFLVISFSQYQEYMIWKISFSKFSDVLHHFTWESTIGNLWSIFSGNKFWVLGFFLFIEVEVLFYNIDCFDCIYISVILFLMIRFLKSINTSLVLFTNS